MREGKRTFLWNSISFKRQMIWCFLTIFAVVLVSTVLYHRAVKSYIEQNNEQYIRDVTTQISRTLEEMLAQVDMLTKEMAYGSEIQSLLQEEQAYSHEDIYSYLMGMARMVEGVDAVSIFNLSGKSYCGYRYGKINILYDIAEEPWFSRLEDTGDLFCYLPGDRAAPILNGEEYLHYVRVIRSVHSMQIAGVMICQINMKWLQGLLEDLSARFEIVDENGTVIVRNFPYDQEESLRWKQQYEGGQEGEGFYREGNQRYYVTSFGMERNGWRIISMTEERELLSGISAFYLNFTVIIGVAVLLIIGISFLFMQSVMRSFQRLMQGTEEIEKGNFDYEIQVRSSQEMGILSDRFNNMSRHLKDLFTKLQEQEKQKRQLELEALSCQISPHFLYNTLSSVKYMAILQKASGIEKIVDALVFMLQKTFRRDSEYVTLQEELDLVEAYLKIMNIRYMNQLQVEMDVEEPVRSCLCINMMIQPIMENAVFYGTQGHTNGCRIRLWARREGDGVTVCVWNNGPAIEKERLDILLDDRVPLKSIGLRNTQHRLRACFGEEYGLSITSEEGEGTSVYIRIPFQKKEA